MCETETPNARRRFLMMIAALPAALGLSTQRADAQQAMIPTASDMEGPYFIGNMPALTNLNRFGKAGEPLRIRGRVMNAASPETPIAGAKLELWHADSSGNYHPEAKGDYADFNDQDLDLRGTVFADQDGYFDVMSILPHELRTRPPHIHYWISAAGYRPLVTQHYLDTDPGNRPHRTAQVIRDQSPFLYPAPTIYLSPL